MISIVYVPSTSIRVDIFLNNLYFLQIWSSMVLIFISLYHVVVDPPIYPCLFGGVFPYFEVTGHPVPVSSLGFKCPDCFIWNCNYIVYPSEMKGPFRGNCLGYFYLWLAFLIAGCVEGIRIALVLGLVLIAGAAIEQAPSVGPILCIIISSMHVCISHTFTSFSSYWLWDAVSIVINIAFCP